MCLADDCFTGASFSGLTQSNSMWLATSQLTGAYSQYGPSARSCVISKASGERISNSEGMCQSLPLWLLV